MRPSIAHVNEQLDLVFPASKHTAAQISHTIGFHHVPRKLGYYLFLVRMRVGG